MVPIEIEGPEKNAIEKMITSEKLESSSKESFSSNSVEGMNENSNQT